MLIQIILFFLLRIQMANVHVFSILNMKKDLRRPAYKRSQVTVKQNSTTSPLNQQSLTETPVNINEEYKKEPNFSASNNETAHLPEMKIIKEKEESERKLKEKKAFKKLFHGFNKTSFAELSVKNTTTKLKTQSNKTNSSETNFDQKKNSDDLHTTNEFIEQKTYFPFPFSWNLLFYHSIYNINQRKQKKIRTKKEIKTEDEVEEQNYFSTETAKYPVISNNANKITHLPNHNTSGKPFLTSEQLEIAGNHIFFGASILLVIFGILAIIKLRSIKVLNKYKNGTLIFMIALILFGGSIAITSGIKLFMNKD